MIELRTFIESVKFVSHAAATKDIRYYLNGILFEFRPSALTLVGCDGHRMAVIEIAGEFGDVHTDFICTNADIKTLLSVYKPSKADVTVNIENGKLVVAGAGNQTLLFEPLEGRYPDWRRVMPQGETVATTEFGVNAIYIADAAKAASRLGNKYVGLKMELRGSNNSMLLSPVVDESFLAIKKCSAVVMPMRL